MTKQSSIFFIFAFAVFLILAFLPVMMMSGGFFFELLKEPSNSLKLLLDSRQLVLLGRSVGLGLYSTFFALLLGLPVAWIWAAGDLRFRKFSMVMILLPLLIPPYIMAGAWIHLLAPSGIINSVLKELFGSTVFISIFSFTGCAWVLGISHFPIIAMITGTGLSKIDSNLEDFAHQNTNFMGKFWHSTLPQIQPHLTASICLVLIFVLGRYAVPSLLGINTYPVEIFSQFSAFYDDSAAVALSIPMVTIVIVLIIIQQMIMKNKEYASFRPSSSNNSPIRLGKIKYLALVFLILVFLATTLFPFLAVLRSIKSVNIIWQTLVSYSDSIFMTSSVALIVAIVSTVIAIPIGKRLSRGNRFLDMLCWIPIAIPGTIIGLGMIKLTNLFPGFRNNDSFGWMLILAYIGMLSAFSIRILKIAYEHFDPNVSDMATMDCRNRLQRLFKVDLPVNSGFIAASVIIVFIFVLGELNASVLLVPPGKATLSVDIDNLLHYGANVKASVLCLIEAALVLVMLLFLMSFIKASGEK